MKFYFILLAGISILLSGCSSSNELIEKKFDTALKQKIQDINKSSEEISVIGKCNKEITTEMKKVLGNSGAMIGTITGDLFTASGNTEKIKKLAEIDFVISLELSQNRDIKFNK